MTISLQQLWYTIADDTKSELRVLNRKILESEYFDTQGHYHIDALQYLAKSISQIISHGFVDYKQKHLFCMRPYNPAIRYIHIFRDQYIPYTPREFNMIYNYEQ